MRLHVFNEKHLGTLQLYCSCMIFFLTVISSLGESGLNLTIRDKPIQEDEGQAKQAMDEMANTLRMVRTN
jgi:hypothetical protein